MSEIEKRELWLDYVRGIACILVVLLHSAAPYLYKLQSIPTRSWEIANFVDSATRISVPLFFMVSGCLFFQSKAPALKNFLRILAALIFYSFVSILYLKIFRNKEVFDLAVGIYSKPVFYHLWFFYSIIPIYIFALIVRVRGIDTAALLLGIVIAFTILNPRLNDIFTIIGLDFKTRLWIGGVDIFYVLYGFSGGVLGLMSQRVPSRVHLIIFAIPIFSTVFVWKATSYLSINAGKFVATFYDYANPLIFVSALSVFFLVRQYSGSLNTVCKPLVFVSKYSLPIYGFHALVLDVFYRTGIRRFEYPVIDISAAFCACLLFSIFLSMLIGKIDKYRLVT